MPRPPRTFALEAVAALTLLASQAGEVLASDVRGTVTTRAVQTRRRPPRYYMGPYRAGRGPEVTEEGGPQQIVVSLEGGPRSSAPPATRAVMAQRDEAFVPHVLAVHVGTTVEFPNEDDFYHNVFSIVAGDRFDLGRLPKGKTGRQTMSKPGAVIVRCEIHPNMKAFVVVLENPHFALPDAEGRYVLPDVPAGQYTLKAWHPTRGEQTRQIVVPATGAVQADFAF